MMATTELKFSNGQTPEERAKAILDWQRQQKSQPVDPNTQPFQGNLGGVAATGAGIAAVPYVARQAAALSALGRPAGLANSAAEAAKTAKPGILSRAAGWLGKQTVGRLAASPGLTGAGLAFHSPDTVSTSQEEAALDRYAGSPQNYRADREPGSVSTKNDPTVAAPLDIPKGGPGTPTISAVPSQGQWSTKQNKGEYVQDGQVKGVFEVQPGTGKAGLYPSNPPPGYEPPTLVGRGNYNIDKGKTGGGTYNEISGPGRGSMTADQWNALSNDERIARNVAAYEGAAKAEHDRYGQAVAAMDGRDYNYETGKVEGPSGPPLVIGKRGWDIPEFDQVGPHSGPLRSTMRGWTDEPKREKGDVPSLSDFIDMMKLQEQQQYHIDELGLKREQLGVEQGWKGAEQQSRDRDYILNEQRTQSQMAETAQKMSRQRQEMLDKSLQSAGLSGPMEGLARTIAAQAPGLDLGTIISILGELSGTMSGSTGEGLFNWREQPYGKLEKFSPKVEEELKKKFQKRLDELRKAQGAK
jgi:hypothetical protein